MKKGKLIVIEGIDGSGKSTQIALLSKSLNEQKIPYEVISFPRYEDNIYGRLIKRYLEGEFGGIGKVSPYLMALAFAGDRALAKSQIEKWLEGGKLVIANRYVSASKAHMGANLPQEQRGEFTKWIEELEYETHLLPKEDLTILLSIDPQIAKKNIVNTGPDIHEEDITHLSEAGKIYEDLAKRENWIIVNCTAEGFMKRREDIHREILSHFSHLKKIP